MGEVATPGLRRGFGSPPKIARAKSWRGARIYTIGHSTRTFDELVALLRSFDISVKFSKATDQAFVWPEGQS